MYLLNFGQSVLYSIWDKRDKRVQGLLNFYKQINTYLQINVNVIKSKVTGDKRGYTVAFDRKD